MAKPEITIDFKKGKLRIYINGILHLSIHHPNYQIQSWKEAKDWYIIVFYTEMGEIQCEYDDVEKWKQILRLVDEQ